MKRIIAVKEGLAAAGPNRSWYILQLWENGFFGVDPFRWAALGKSIGASMDEIQEARYKFRRRLM